MFRKTIFLAIYLTLLVFSVNIVFCADFYDDVDKFVKLNPDGDKYEFAKIYITSLTYIKSNEERADKKIDINSNNLEDVDSVGKLIDGLILDSVNWRVAKNMMKKYYDPKNGLILKVSDIFIGLSGEQIDLNSKERFLLGELHEAQMSGDVYNFDSYKFFKKIKDLEAKRKESLKKLLEASILVTKVLISNKTNEYGELVYLGITSDQRDKLLFKLDDFYGEEYEGALREGQSFLQASISTLKEFLSDYTWKTLDEINQ